MPDLLGCMAFLIAYVPKVVRRHRLDVVGVLKPEPSAPQSTMQQEY